jgi:lipoprotein-anchoring transpeptidase ErfK/SrfK
MVDYYAILLRAVTAPYAGDAQWRRDVFERARQMLVTRLRARRPPASEAEIAAEQAALDAAIERLEAEMAWTDGGGGISDIALIKPERGPIAKPLQSSGRAWIVAAIIVAAIGAGGYAFLTHTSQKSAPQAVKSEAPVQIARATAKDGDLAPGIDGGSADPDLSYVYRRQATFYRTLQPVGTVIVDKSQHYLYLIQPNNVAMRYGIGLGSQCFDLAGLRHISSKAEWPQWQAPPDMVKRKLASAGTLPGGPGNPLGARLLALDDNSSRINGTNAPKTIGSSVEFGCIRLANDDIMDLYNRVQVGAQVLVN